METYNFKIVLDLLRLHKGNPIRSQFNGLSLTTVSALTEYNMSLAEDHSIITPQLVIYLDRNT
jgi:hypothetical protein